MTIEVANSLSLGQTNTPLDARTRIATLADVSTVANPYVGMRVYVLDEAKSYIVKSLKDKLIGAYTVPDAQIDTVEIMPPSNAQKNSDITKAEIEAKLKGDITTHTHNPKVPAPMLFPIPKTIAGDPALHFMLEVHTTADYSATPIVTVHTTTIQTFVGVFDGTAWVGFPEEGIGTPYYGNKIKISPTPIMLNAQCYIRYKLYPKGDDPDTEVWKHTLYPAIIVE